MEYEIDSEVLFEDTGVEPVHQRPRWRTDPRDRDPQRAIAIPDEEFAAAQADQ
jgi:hypothetical protein